MRMAKSIDKAVSSKSELAVTKPASRTTASRKPERASNSKEKVYSRPVGAMSNETIERVIDTLEATYPHHPMGDLAKGHPYKVLVACVLSLRTKDEVSIPASRRLFSVADTPAAMVKLQP